MALALYGATALGLQHKEVITTLLGKPRDIVVINLLFSSVQTFSAALFLVYYGELTLRSRNLLLKGHWRDLGLWATKLGFIVLSAHVLAYRILQTIYCTIGRAFSGEHVSNALYSFGNGSQGALGCDSTADSYSPEHVTLPDDIVGISAGHYHSLAWTSQGQLFSWGRNNEQQLGRVHADEDAPFGVSNRPGIVGNLDKKVTSCAASGVASIAVGSEGTLYSFGMSKRGQLGLGKGRIAADAPERIPGVEGVTAVSCGWGHALAISEGGEVLSWGFPSGNRLGNLLNGDTAQMGEQEALDSCVWSPQKVIALEGIQAKQVCCSLDSSLVLAKDGTLHTFGDNSLGQLGRPSLPEHGPEDWVVRDAAGTPLRFKHVAAGLAHCLAVTLDGKVLVLGLGASQSVSEPELVQDLEGLRIKNIACGHDHTLVLTG
ncbi:hypothetical protein WJX75_005773 [Coccomyxa subellipsoidea]|uniref:RCC1-like domain-containing protein n=1 Tax=Coccomyxa subellipsoidea TaxID=248742 RepID=A0ABR2YU48_9CHLO